MSILKIKRSGTTGAPPALAQAELAYSYLAGTLSNGGDRLYIGTGTETNGAAANIEVIGGKYFTEKLDHTPGILTANSAIITDADNKINQLLVDNLSLDGNSITSTNLNGNIVLDPNGSGVIQLNGPVEFSETVTFAANASFETLDANTLSADTGTIGSLAVSDLTNSRVVFAGASGELQDSANLAFNGSVLTVTGTTNTTNLVAGSARVSDLTQNRIVVVGASGELQDFAGLTYTTAQFTVSTNTQITGTTTVTGEMDVDNLNFNGSTISTTSLNSNLVLSTNGLGNIVVNNSRITGVANPTGNTDVVTLGYLQNTYTSVLTFTGDSGSDTIDLRTQTLDISGNTGITTTVTNNQIDIDLDNTTVVPGTYGSTTAIPTFTVDQQGRLTAASEVQVATVLNITGDTGSDVVNLLTETLDFQGGTGVTTTVSNNQVTIAIGQDVSTSANVTFQDVEVSGNLSVDGDLLVSGNTATINVNTIAVEDPLIYLATQNLADTVDIGVAGLYDGNTTPKYTGIFRDATNSEWYIFDSYQPADVNSNVIDRNNPSFSLSTLNADIYRFSQIALSLTGDVVGAVNISNLGAGNISISTAIQPNSVALGTDTTGNYVQSVSVTSGTGLSLAGSGEGAVVTIAGVNATTTGTKGVATYDATNFDVTAGLVSIDTVDGGAY